MILKKYTVTTQLHEKHNADLIAYMEAFRGLYAKALRETFYAMRGNPNFKKHRYNTFLQKKYGILKRTAGSILEEAKGRFHALLALKKYERAQLRRKIKALEEDLLPKLMEKRQFSCDKTKADLQALAARLVKESLHRGKDLCLESLDFANKKASACTGKNKTYNQMLHSFPYRIFSEAVQQIAHRKQAGIQRVNPAWTSRIAKEVYSVPRKLNIHSGATFVIARRGQGLVETLPKKIA